ncbi:MAG: hypothetical protein JNN18_18860 [Rubrivivax sp.]|nr:hypothetical protein [Rubrivivax sp.]
MDTALTHDRTAGRPGTGAATRLLAFNDDVLAQGAALAAAHEADAAAPFEPLVGPHLRHVIEHYEALLMRAGAHEVDYDSRPRDRALEHSPTLARERIAALRAALHGGGAGDIDDPIVVHARIGLEGQWPLITTSTVGRELVFLASHAVHHYALLREHCVRHGLAVSTHFGIAPATVAHARQRH